MKVKYDGDTIAFGELKPGDVFASRDRCMVKFETVISDIGYRVNAVNLANGELHCFAELANVILHPKAVCFIHGAEHANTSA